MGEDFRMLWWKVIGKWKPEAGWLEVGHLLMIELVRMFGFLWLVLSLETRLKKKEWESWQPLVMSWLFWRLLQRLWVGVQLSDMVWLLLLCIFSISAGLSIFCYHFQFQVSYSEQSDSVLNENKQIKIGDSTMQYCHSSLFHPKDSHLIRILSSFDRQSWVNIYDS